MGSELERENRGIDNPNVLQAVYPQLGIDDTSLTTGQHCEGIRRMELRDDTVGDEVINRVIGGDGRTRSDLLTENILQGGGGCDLPSKLEALPHQHYIGRMGQVLRIKGRVVKGIVGGDVQPSLTVWVLEGDLDRERLLVAAPNVSKGKEQQLDLSDGTIQEPLSVDVVKNLVAVDNCRILAGTDVGHRGVEASKDVLLEGCGVIGAAHEGREVRIVSSRGDVGEEWGRLSKGNVPASALRQHRSQGIRSGRVRNGRALEGKVNTCALIVATTLTMWSCKWFPTPGKSIFTSTLAAVKTSFGPIPLCIKILGLPIAPAANITSFLTLMVVTGPPLTLPN